MAKQQQPALFDAAGESLAPLAHRMRPHDLSEVVGQKHVIGPDRLLTQIHTSPILPSLLFWGPPGTGKTTLAFILAMKKGFYFEPLSAVTSGIKDVKEVIDRAALRLSNEGIKTVLFLDEIHRFNKAQQDALLPAVERGIITLIGATTENPSFSVNNALLSRSRVVVLYPLSPEDLRDLALRALSDDKRGLGGKNLSFPKDALDFLCAASHGDARYMFNILETAAGLAQPDGALSMQILESALQTKAIDYDKTGEEHYNIISAFIKSMRGSDPDAALYYMARMLEGGEEPLFICRRMVIFASEDVGNADPYALTLAIATMQAFDFVGMPEGWIPMAQCVSYLASVPKSNASYMGYQEALADVREHGPLPVPLHLRNAPTKLMKDLGYHKGYQYAHDHLDHIANQTHLPEKLTNKQYYRPSDNGREAALKVWLDKARQRREQK